MSTFGENIDEALVHAREMQMRRLAGIFAKGFKLPREICDEYLQKYAAYANSIEKRPEVYRGMCTDFWTAVETTMKDRGMKIPAELNELDRATIFGEVCTGERRADGELVTLPRTVH